MCLHELINILSFHVSVFAMFISDFGVMPIKFLNSLLLHPVEMNPVLEQDFGF